MMYSFKKVNLMQSIINIRKYFYSITCLFIFTVFFEGLVLAKNNDRNQNYLSSKSTNNISISKKSNLINEQYFDDYILDSGDSLYFLFTGLDIYSKIYSVDRKGFINLPEIGNYYVRGKIISEIIPDINKKYEKYIYNPDIKIDISNYRSVSVYVNGEILKPGLYNLSDQSATNSASEASAFQKYSSEPFYFGRNEINFLNCLNYLKEQVV